MHAEREPMPHSPVFTESPCPFEPAVDVVLGRWTSHVLWILAHHGEMRFSELRAAIPQITPKVLTERLRQLERNGLITRRYQAAMPPRVDYAVTPLARSLIPVFRTLAAWSDEHLPEVSAAQRHYDALHAGGDDDDATAAIDRRLLAG